MLCRFWVYYKTFFSLYLKIFFHLSFCEEILKLFIRGFSKFSDLSQHKPYFRMTLFPIVLNNVFKPFMLFFDDGLNSAYLLFCKIKMLL